MGAASRAACGDRFFRRTSPEFGDTASKMPFIDICLLAVTLGVVFLFPRYPWGKAMSLQREYYRDFRNPSLQIANR